MRWIDGALDEETHLMKTVDLGVEDSVEINTVGTMENRTLSLY